MYREVKVKFGHTGKGLGRRRRKASDSRTEARVWIGGIPIINISREFNGEMLGEISHGQSVFLDEHWI